MSSDVVLTSALRNNLLSLQNTQRLIDKTQLRLATGLKVNSALDNPQNFFAAQSLNNRASDLQRLLDGIGQSIRTIEEANNGVTALTNLIEQAQSVATEALSEARAAEGFARVRGTEDLRGVNLVTDTAIDDGDVFTLSVEQADGTTVGPVNITIGTGAGQATTVDGIVAQINSNATINDVVQARVTTGGQLQIESLEDGATIRIADSDDSAAGNNELDLAGFQALGLGDFVQAENTNTGATTVRYGGSAIAGNTIASAASGTATGAGGEFEASQTLASAGFLTTGNGATDELRVNISIDGTTSANIDLAEDDTIQEFVDAVNNDASIGSLVTASFDTDTGEIKIQADSSVGQLEIQYTDINGNANSQFSFGTGAGDGAIGTGGSAQSEQFTFVGTSVDLEQYESDYNELRSQIDTIVEDANYRGVNLLAGDNLETFFNEDRDNTLVTDGVDFTASGLGIDEGAFTTAASIQLSIDDTRASLESVRNFGQSIANDLSIVQTRRDFTEQTINTLTSGADDLTVADQNEEGANLLALQTRQALGTTSLSLASQSQQSVLRLF